jgi:hypothetical protein
MLFAWLITGQVFDANPAAVRAPKHVVKKGKTPVLTADEARSEAPRPFAGRLPGQRPMDFKLSPPVRAGGPEFSEFEGGAI